MITCCKIARSLNSLIENKFICKTIKAIDIQMSLTDVCLQGWACFRNDQTITRRIDELRFFYFCLILINCVAVFSKERKRMNSPSFLSTTKTVWSHRMKMHVSSSGNPGHPGEMVLWLYLLGSRAVPEGNTSLIFHVFPLHVRCKK